jgi:membrane protein YqaA with SNARE-associated domain
MIAVLAAAAVGILSAFLPVTPAEPYLIAAAAADQGNPVALGLAAALGQAVGKLVIFLAARGALNSPWLRRKLAAARRAGRHRRARSALFDRPGPATGILAASAVVGIPPLLATSVYLGTTRMRPAVFAAVCFAGRAVRFIAIAYAPGLAGY